MAPRKLVVIDDTRTPPLRMGTITETPDGIVCEPVAMADLLRAPDRIGADPFNYLSGWSNGYVSVKEVTNE